ncbi:MAG: helix-turn-helix domain-containing protein [Patescibacteria group bacterium]
MIEAVLKKFGLSEKAITIYLSLLKLGSAPVRKIANEAGLNRTTTHDILNELISQGLASFVDKTKHRYFTAEGPEHLLTALKIRKNQIEQTEQDVAKILPELKSLFEKSPSKPKAKYFEGQVGLRAILQDVLDTVSRTAERNYCVYSSSAIRDVVHNVFPNYNNERKRLKISVQSISIGPGGSLHGLDERKWLSKEEGSPTYTLLYADKVALIALDDKHSPMGVILEDKNSFQTQMMIFNSLWQKL